MKTTFSRRSLIRLTSFLLFAIAILGASNIVYMKKIEKLENSVQAGYQSSVESLAQSADRISSVLEKGRYTASPEMMSRLSAELLKSSGEAKSALEALPVRALSTDNLEKFLSQVGNYAASLSRRATAGEKLSERDRENVLRLSECAEKLSEDMWSLRTKILTSDYSMAEIFDGIDTEVGSFLADGISGIEDGLKDLPKLIYDGPFSDHILERTPIMTQNAEEITEDEALEKAAKAMCEEPFRVLKCEAGEEGKLPAYCFYCDGTRCAVSKNGGYVVYSIKSRKTGTETLSRDDAEGYAREYLESLGIEDMEKTYSESLGGVCTINYAYNDGEAICYTDLIKVSVALDNGEILGFDARGYLVNHRERSFKEPAFSEEEAVEKLADGLTPVSCRLALIPLDTVEEKLCYEIKCRTESGQDILVYLNSQTGEEEEILILLKTEGGELTV